MNVILMGQFQVVKDESGQVVAMWIPRSAIIRNDNGEVIDVGCALCGRPFPKGWTNRKWRKDEHHVSYTRNETIFLCRKCHRRVETSKEGDFFYNFKARD